MAVAKLAERQLSEPSCFADHARLDETASCLQQASEAAGKLESAFFVFSQRNWRKLEDFRPLGPPPSGRHSSWFCLAQAGARLIRLIASEPP